MLRWLSIAGSVALFLGVRICVEILHELATIPGVAGAHIMAPQNPSAIAEVLAAFDTAAQL